MTKNCIARGMTMEKPEDYAERDLNKDYCRFCARPDGSMQNYKEKLESMAQFIVNTQGLDEKAARNTARNLMANLPAWKDKLYGVNKIDSDQTTE